MLKYIPFILLLTLSACGDKSTSPTAPTPAPAPVAPVATKATVTKTQIGRAQICLSPLPIFNYRMILPLRINVTGLAVNLNYMEAVIFRNGRQVERATIGADVIIRVNGTNTIAAGSSISYNWIFNYNTDVFAPGVQGVIGIDYTDVRGNRFRPPQVINPSDIEPLDIEVLLVCTLAASEGAT